MDYIYSHRLDVRFRDCDPLGHANNAVYLTYLEQARFSHWRELWGFGTSELASDTPGVILARVEIDYRAQVRYGDTIEVRIGLGAVGRTSFTYDYEIVDGHSRVVATAKTVQVMFDYGASKPVPIPDEIRARLGTRATGARG
jgi:acyl-CoA thioester hydrolase